MNLIKIKVEKIRNKRTNQVEAEFYGEHLVLGWLGTRCISRDDWKYIGDEMGWFEK